jgi:hypothetical protein
MRRYSETAERRVRAQAHVRKWARAGLIDASQAAKLANELRVDLVRTNVFLRATAALFTALIVFAIVGFVWSSLELRTEMAAAILAGGAAIVCIALAELAVGTFRLYRFGVEEMLAACCVVLLSVGATQLLKAWRAGSSWESMLVVGLAVAAAGAFAVYRRFGFVWAALGSMCCAAAIPFQFDELAVDTRRAIAAGVLAVVFLLTRGRRKQYGEEWPGDEYSDLQAAAFAGIYLLLNLRLVDVIDVFNTVYAKGWFYWSTWILTWVLPAAGLAMSIRDKDRPLLIVSGVMSIVTLMTNKPYLGWTRNTWDPMLLGALLIGITLILRRWLAGGPDGSRRGFVATRILLGHDPLLTVLSAAPFSVQPHTPPAAQPANSGFDGGRSGGAGAGGSF